MKRAVLLYMAFSLLTTVGGMFGAYYIGFKEGWRRARQAALVTANVVLADILDAREKAG